PALAKEGQLGPAAIFRSSSLNGLTQRNTPAQKAQGVPGVSGNRSLKAWEDQQQPTTVPLHDHAAAYRGGHRARPAVNRHPRRGIQSSELLLSKPGARRIAKHPQIGEN